MMQLVFLAKPNMFFKIPQGKLFLARYVLKGLEYVCAAMIH
jgi:hypothetical protein